MILKQSILDEEKFKRFKETVESYKKSGVFENYGELAILLDYSKNTLYQIMSDEGVQRNPPDILIYKFCEYFKLHPSWFFGRSSKLESIQAVSKESLAVDDLIKLHKLTAEASNLASNILSEALSVKKKS